ncbi:hypothetical protein KKH82_06910 [Patescibacteria group bacterium]|nr:hypothetical protein [Patescibacteria group bacterium]
MVVEVKNQNNPIEQGKDKQKDINLVDKMTPEEIKDFLKSENGKKLNNETGKALKKMFEEHEAILN